MSIFVIVFSVGIGGFVSAMRTQRQVQALISANSNASLIIEQMAREMRTGLAFKLSPGDCSGSALPCRLQFTTGRNEDVTYRWDKSTEQIFRYGSMTGLDVPITAENVAVKYFGFVTMGADCSDPTAKPSVAPRVTMVLGVAPRSERGVTEDVTEIQTTVSSRQGFICAYPDGSTS